MAWSCGKDSAYALWRLQCDPRFEVVALLTTLTEGYRRVSMSGVRRELLLAQAESLGLGLYESWIPQRCPNELYERAMAEAIERLRADGVRAIAFGDLYLEDVRAYRERMMSGTGLELLFPLWGEDTRALPARMLAEGFRARVVCVDTAKLPASMAGREYDEAFLRELPEGVDPCGENGEFHTFVYDGPGFRFPIAVEAGETVERDGFAFADLAPATAVGSGQ